MPSTSRAGISPALSATLLSVPSKVVTITISTHNKACKTGITEALGGRLPGYPAPLSLLASTVVALLPLAALLLGWPTWLVAVTH